MFSTKVTVIDYGLGNLLSVKRAFEFLNVEVEITDSPIRIQRADRLIIPGVGAFPRGMAELTKRNLIEPIKLFNNLERPMLAICLGMQLLMEHGEEHQKTEGLNLVKGRVIRFPSHNSELKVVKIPHIGWCEISLESKHERYEKFKLFENAQMYFVHSYYVELEDEKDLLSESKNGSFDFCSTFSSKNILGCQFHPEKSGVTGLNFLNNFMSI